MDVGWKKELANRMLIKRYGLASLRVMIKCQADGSREARSVGCCVNRKPLTGCKEVNWRAPEDEDGSKIQCEGESTLLCVHIFETAIGRPCLSFHTHVLTSNDCVALISDRRISKAR